MQPLQLAMANVADSEPQDQFGIPPDGLLGQGNAAGDVERICRIGELRFERMGDGEVGIGQVREHDADPSVRVAGKHMPRPLHRRVDFRWPVGGFHPLQGSVAHRAGPVVAHRAAGPFDAPQQIDELRRYPVEGHQMEAFCGAGNHIGEFGAGDQPLLPQAFAKASGPAPEDAGVHGSGESRVVQSDAMGVQKRPSLRRQFAQRLTLRFADFLPQQQLGFPRKQARPVAERQDLSSAAVEETVDARHLGRGPGGLALFDLMGAVGQGELPGKALVGGQNPIGGAGLDEPFGQLKEVSGHRPDCRRPRALIARARRSTASQGECIGVRSRHLVTDGG